jgi:putative transposase
MTKVWCGADGWGYLFTVVDTCTREWVGYAFSPFCRAKEALYLVEMAVQQKFPESWKADGITLRTDNGPQYTARYFVANLKALGINHERARYRTPEDIGVVERLHKNLKRDYLWLYDFGNFQEAEHVILNAFDHYNQIRPHSSLGYKSPLEYLREVEQHVS